MYLLSDQIIYNLFLRWLGANSKLKHDCKSESINIYVVNLYGRQQLLVFPEVKAGNFKKSAFSQFPLNRFSKGVKVLKC